MIRACLLLLAILCSCRPAPTELEVVRRTRLAAAPSGSALLLRGDTAYLVGDDATGVYRFQAGDSSVQKLPVAGLDYHLFREPRARKHDFEASVWIESATGPTLIALGSGSRNTNCDSALSWPLNHPGTARILSLEKVYEALRQRSAIAQGAWNIEGAALAGDTLYLFNRGSNSVFAFPIAHLLRSINSDTVFLPSVRVRQLQLPTIRGKAARVSGACTLNESQLLICASVEDTHDWTRDGEVLGSFIGVYSVHEGRLLKTWLLRDDKGLPRKEKVESLDLLRRNNDGSLQVLAVADNDDGASTLLELRLPPP
ncbi:MAG: hypothetical protein EOO08_13120 [Chitinophagaceae bacterium]|nr:MAG: hypothetical protein EOO08_13120 [Chitinophagaceae bacterium]